MDACLGRESGEEEKRSEGNKGEVRLARGCRDGDMGLSLSLSAPPSPSMCSVIADLESHFPPSTIPVQYLALRRNTVEIGMIPVLHAIRTPCISRTPRNLSRTQGSSISPVIAMSWCPAGWRHLDGGNPTHCSNDSISELGSALGVLGRGSSMVVLPLLPCDFVFPSALDVGVFRLFPGASQLVATREHPLLLECGLIGLVLPLVPVPCHQGCLRSFLFNARVKGAKAGAPGPAVGRCLSLFCRE